MSNMSANIKANPVGVAVVGVVSLLILLYWFGIPGLSNSRREVKEVCMKELLSASIHAARLGGDKVKEIRETATLNEEVKGQTKEGANELKTDGDMASHILMFHGLQNAFPGLEVVSEEHENKPLKDDEVKKLDIDLPDVKSIEGKKLPVEDITVWIDPLDATQEYTEDLRQYVTTMVCVAVKGLPVIGVIHRAFDQKTVWAYVGEGKSDNLQLQSMDHGTDGSYSIIVSRSHSGTVENVAKKSFGENTKVIPAGGAGFKTLEVIEGRADAYVHVTAIKKWDICAGDAILRAVNGHLTTLTNKEIDYSATGSPVNAEGLLATTKDHEKYLDPLRPIFEEQNKSRAKRDLENYRVANREN